MAKTRAPAKPTAKTAKPPKQPAAKKPAAKKPAAKKPAARATRPVTKRRGAPPLETLDATELLARVSLFARADQDVGDELAPLVARLEQIAEPSLVPALVGVLDDDDPRGVLWPLFYLLEGFDDAYLDGLLAALPELYERAPGWAETAVLRIANTRGEPEDCTGTFVALARGRKAAPRRKLVTLIDRIARDTEGLNVAQRRSVESLARAIEG